MLSYTDIQILSVAGARYEGRGKLLLACQRAGIVKAAFMTKPLPSGGCATARKTPMGMHEIKTSNSAEPEVLMKINTTPLIVTIPSQRHSVKLAVIGAEQFAQ